jgi:2-hydroxy-3-keto-5-methylthiopentenyl-1-phosphate phosphatase
LIVYIGDGLSDRCGVEKSDIVFAKDDLKTFCIENKIDFYEFENFEDILMMLKKLVSN